MIAENLTGQKLGQYHILEVIGKGGMGVVYRAIKPGVSGEFAIKVLAASSPEYSRRFQQETEIASRLKHPHIVPVHDSGTINGLSYVVMRLLNGGTLAQHLYMPKGAKYPDMPVSRTAQIIQQIASALDYAHSQNIIHRDIKTSNILFDENDVPYLVDFGVAKVTTHNATSLTSSGMIVGTLPYVAPEQLRDDPLTSAVDQYALAVMAYYILSGKMPFHSDSTYAIMQKLLFEQPTALSKHREDIPGEVMDVILRGMAKQPQDRYPSAGAFAAAFTNALNPSKPATRPRTADVKPVLPKTKTDVLSPHAQRRTGSGQGQWILLLLFVLVIAAGFVLTQTDLLSQITSPQAVATDQAACVIRPKSSTNVRRNPNDDEANILRAYSSSDRVVLQVNGRTTNAEGEIWWRITLPQFEGEDFWVSDQAVNQTGNCAALPDLTPP